METGLYIKRVVKTTRVPGKKNERYAWLECGHRVICVGEIQNNGALPCAKCRYEAAMRQGGHGEARASAG
jgi:hypothetical protein